MGFDRVRNGITRYALRFVLVRCALVRYGKTWYALRYDAVRFSEIRWRVVRCGEALC